MICPPIRALVMAILLLPARLMADSPDAVVTFSELHYHPVTSQDGEWLELHNQMAVNIDLSRWSLADGIQYTFPKGTIIGPGQYLVVAKNPAGSSLSGVAGVVGPYQGSLSNSGETIDLLSPTGRLMDRISYGDDGDWPVAADGLGASLAKQRDGTASEPAENWAASRLPGGTPGRINHPVADGPVLHELIGANSPWRFDDSGSAPPDSWKQLSFNDSQWREGQGPFGSGAASGDLLVTGPLVARFRAGAITGVANGAVPSEWSDSHTADGAAQHAVSGGNPTLRSQVTPSGEAVVRLDGNDEFRTSTSMGIAGNSGFVYFIVCRANGPVSSAPLYSGAGDYLFDRNVASLDAPLASLKPVDGKFGFQVRYDDNSGLGGPISTTPISTSEFQIVAVRRNTAVSRFEVWVDGVMEGASPDNGNSLTPQPIVIGRHAQEVNGGFNGDIAEVLIFRDALADEDFQSVGSYLEGRYGLDTAFPDGAIRTETADTPTRYFRKSFSFAGDPAQSNLRLEHTLADGAVFYLNGQEIARTNLPDGPAGHTTVASTDVSAPAPSGIITLPAGSLVAGPNVLAVSLHSAAGDTTGFFSARLGALESPSDPQAEPHLQLNEIAAADADSFFVEIRNTGNMSADLTGYRVFALDPIAGSSSYVLPSITLAAGDRLALGEAELGFRAASGAKVGLFAPGGGVLDARVVTNRLRGRSDRYPGLWVFPSAPTPGTVNQFNLQQDIVINEICYHPPDLPAVAGTPPVVTTLALLPYNANWRYHAAGGGLPSGWAAEFHPVGGNWQNGPGVHAYSGGSLPVPIGTALSSPLGNNPYIVTYYFETEFNLTDDAANGLSGLRLNHLIDDGAVFYLNGIEIYRYNMPAGPVTASTLAASGIGTAAANGPNDVPLPQGLAVAGTNRISVEVHQVSTNSSDIVFGLQLAGVFTTDPGTPASPPRRSEEQWIELYNRGAGAVDLTGWNFSSGITFTFPAGTTLPSGGYLLVSNNPARHSGLPVAGPFSGNLSRRGEKLVLRDSFNNPANVVSYLDGGRWPGDADGDGGTLELRDPRADNSLPDSWAASDESSRHQWQSHSYRGVASSSAVGPDDQWREFVFGLLNDGEILIDDIQVIEDPDGAAIPLIQGGSFEGSTAGWRFLGNHRHANIVADPENPTNKVLHLRATGATEHMHNHVETTLANGRSVTNGRTYQISFRTRWLRGTNLLNTRLYFNRLAKTTVLVRPEKLGTPAASNSTAVANLGPAITAFSHDPPVPAPAQPVTITARASDPDGVAGVTLHYSVAGAPFAAVGMTPASDGETFSATIPGQAAATVVRFYVAAMDAAASPAAANFPAGGADSHALYQVNDGMAASNGLQNLRIIMDPADKQFLHQLNNVMSNGRVGCTVIYNEREIYYDVGVRLKSSQRGRSQPARVGFNLGFNKDQLFRGIHRTIAIDRSEGQSTGAGEILFDHMMNRSGGIPAEYNDLVKVIAPDPAHTSPAILQLARFGDAFLDSQFENGSNGTVYEYELIYYPTTTDSDGYKLPQPDGVVGTTIRDLGDDKENYRWNFLTKNNEDADDYARVIAMAKHFSLTGTAFQQGVEGILDVDQWLSALAVSCATGAGDSFFANSNHNGQFYARPSDGRMLYFPHDMDFSFNATRSIYENNQLQKLVSNPAYRRTYLGYLHHLCTTIYNHQGMEPWAMHYGSLLPGENFSSHLSYIGTRSNYILNAIDNEFAPVTFAIATNGGANFQTQSTPVTLTGQGWVDVREIRLAGSEVPLEIQWTTANTWQARVPLSGGANLIALEAWNLDGQIVGTDSIVVTNTGSIQAPNSATLVVSEIYYNPPGQNEVTEFVELLNISSTATLDLSGVLLSGDSVGFTIPPGTMLGPGGRLVVAKDLAAFAAAYGNVPNTVGGYANNLSNSGETLVLRGAGGAVIRSFAYSDAPPWPAEADGDGWSLTLANPTSNPNHGDPLNWRASYVKGGSPGEDDALPYDEWKLANGNHGDDEDIDGDGFTTLAEFFLGGDPRTAESHLLPAFSIDPDGAILLTLNRLAAAEGAVGPEISQDLNEWQAAPPDVLFSRTRLPGSPAFDRLSYRIPPPAEGGRLFVRMAFRR